MIAEVAILLAYAFASQGKYDEAEQLLASVPEALNTPSGADLLARIKFEQGDESAARRIWEGLLAVDPSSESARNALAALDASPCKLCDGDVQQCFCCRWKYVCAFTLAVLLGLAFSLGKAWKCTSSEMLQAPKQSSCQHSRVIAEQMLEISKINGKVLAELRDGILTNLTEGVVLVLSGGKGKYVTDRQRNLSVIADCIGAKLSISLSQMYLQPAGETSDEVRLTLINGGQWK